MNVRPVLSFSGWSVSPPLLAVFFFLVPSFLHTRRTIHSKVPSFFVLHMYLNTLLSDFTKYGMYVCRYKPGIPAQS
ncbi:hypothetical protein F4809DRAFT_593948 [Biscogniauxia mediterranea]|nr:hypothetical protein F4809DRAFT_593948 [Biscogniauxia mediterranea]